MCFMRLCLEALDTAVMGVRVSGDPATLAPRIRAIAAGLDPGLRLDEVRPLDEMAWRADMPMMAIAGTFAGIVGLGLFVSASGIFSHDVGDRREANAEIGLRAALGATHARLLAGIFCAARHPHRGWHYRRASRAPSGGEIGNFDALGRRRRRCRPTSAVMLTVGLLACVEPARRALRINPTDALKEV